MIMNTALTMLLWTVILGALVSFLVAVLIFVLCRILKYTERFTEKEHLQSEADEEIALVLAAALNCRNTK